MLIRFWGVRGSLPSPIRAAEVKAKVSSILEQMVPEDLASAESRKRFIDGLPPWLYGTVGGNSLCVSVDVEGGNEPFVFDCGSGLREMGIVCGAANPAPSQYHIFFSHFHWDHLLGFPFFSPAYNPSVTLDFYAPKPGIEEGLRTMMSEPHFPVRLENMMSQKRFHLLESPVSIGQTAAGPVSISFKKMKHPGDSFSYALDHNGKRFIYATDVELTPADFEPNEENTGFFKGADLIALDSQYTLGEAMEKYNWGHTAFSVAVEFAVNWGIQHLVMLHHEPAYDDHKLYEILQSARRHLQRMDAVNKIEISLAVEGLEIAL